MPNSQDVSPAQPLVDAADPASVLVVLSLTDIERADAWVEIQPHCDDRGRDGIATSLRDCDDDPLIARHFAVLKDGETMEQAAQRVAGAFKDAELAEVCIVTCRLDSLFSEFQEKDLTRAPDALGGPSSPTLQ